MRFEEAVSEQFKINADAVQAVVDDLRRAIEEQQRQIEGLSAEMQRLFELLKETRQWTGCDSDD